MLGENLMEGAWFWKALIDMLMCRNKVKSNFTLSEYHFTYKFMMYIFHCLFICCCLFVVVSIVRQFWFPHVYRAALLVHN